jgi:signal transduction histidine kinase
VNGDRYTPAVSTRGSVTGRHVAIAVLVLVVVNAQLTWWIIYTTGQARERLELERGLLESNARSWAKLAAATGPDSEPPVPEDLEIVAGSIADPGRPAIAVEGDPRGRLVRPTEAAWNGVLEEYRRRIVMMVSEGSFFAVLLIVFMGLLWRTFRREVELERQHRNFLSAITHELRSPIAAIRIALETVTSGRADESAARRFIGNALADTDRLDLLVQKVLHATRFGSGGPGVRRTRRSVDGVVARAVADFEPGAVMAGAVVDVEIESDLWAEVDDEALTIVVSNLLENALKYGGSPARIGLDLRRERDRLVLDVSDNGRGIPDDEIPKVFDRFYRAGDEMTRTSRGTGLGLYLVQRIMKAHHGSVEIAETSERGTTVRVTLPGVDAEEDRE